MGGPANASRHPPRQTNKGGNMDTSTSTEAQAELIDIKNKIARLEVDKAELIRAIKMAPLLRTLLGDIVHACRADQLGYGSLSELSVLRMVKTALDHFNVELSSTGHLMLILKGPQPPYPDLDPEVKSQPFMPMQHHG